jgi:cardiolipin synthase
MTIGKYPKKVWFLMVVGAGALVLLVATLFTNFTEKQPDLSSTVALSLGSPDFAAAVESITHSRRLPVEGEIELFNDGTAFMNDLLGEIRAAEHSVTLTNYIFRDGTMTGSTFDAMTERARNGVEVRLLLDWKGSSDAPEDKLEALEQAGGKVETFRPFGFRYLTRIHRRTHVRAIVIDGEVGYTGGLAFDDEWFGDGVGPNRWRDLMFKYRGELARSTQDHFNALWRQTNGEILSGPGFLPTVSTSTDTSAVDATHGGGTEVTTTTAAAATRTDTVSGAPAGGSWFVGLFHNPVPDLSTDLQDLIWLSIRGASSHVLIATPYMTPDSDIREAIMDAARRGVRVEIVMPGPYTDAKPIQAATRAYYDELLEAGVRIFEYQPGRFHEKTITADGHWSIVGSANMDNRSATLNVENVFAIEDRRLAAALEAELELAKQRTVEITLENWHPNPLKSLYFNFARVFAKQY